MITFEEFYEAVKGKMPFGLDEKTAKEIVSKGREFADFYEKTALHAMYLQMQRNLPLLETTVKVMGAIKPEFKTWEPVKD